ncbi:MAG TPA: hypothetical protein ACHBY4_02965 [Arsenophonus apicola]|uniref:hypothetical protein n=1 Tax=Arsenophonus apicola TaxID=2879119 RepID=UPI00387A777A
MRLDTLKNYPNKNGTLKFRGKRFLGDKPNKITSELLTEIVSLGAKEIAKSGGLRGLSKQYRVNLKTLKNYIFENGILTFKGESFLAD